MGGSTNDPMSSEYFHLTEYHNKYIFYNHFSSYDFPCFWIKDLRYRLIAINPNNCTSNKPYHLYLWRYGFKSNLTLSYIQSIFIVLLKDYIRNACLCKYLVSLRIFSEYTAILFLYSGRQFIENLRPWRISISYFEVSDKIQNVARRYWQ